jgi:hypothetical protein
LPGARIQFGAAVHDDFDPKRLCLRRCGIVEDAELHPDHPRPGVERKRLVDDPPGSRRVAENVHHVDGPRNIRQNLEKRRAVNALAGEECAVDVRLDPWGIGA